VLLVVNEDYPRTLLEPEWRFSSEEACIEYLASLRWPSGWMCPRCAATEGWTVRRNRWLCGHCRYEMPVTAGTVFQDSHLPLTIWFRAIWQVASQKNGVSALGLQRVLGLGSYKTAWAMLHKLRRAIVRPGRDRLPGAVEVDETYWGAEGPNMTGRLTENKTLLAVAAEEDGGKIGRIRLSTIPDLTRATLHGFIAASIEPGSTVRTDGFASYLEMDGYVHQREVQIEQPEGEYVTACSSCNRPAEALDTGHASGSHWRGVPGRLLERVSLPLQPPHFGLARQTLLPGGVASHSDRTCYICRDG
jgi:transposase-like protein